MIGDTVVYFSSENQVLSGRELFILDIILKKI
jgi:hypothetical protein